jgi:hypothetical protein
MNQSFKPVTQIKALSVITWCSSDEMKPKIQANQLENTNRKRCMYVVSVCVLVPVCMHVCMCVCVSVCVCVCLCVSCEYIISHHVPSRMPASP